MASLISRHVLLAIVLIMGLAATAIAQGEVPMQGGRVTVVIPLKFMSPALAAQLLGGYAIYDTGPSNAGRAANRSTPHGYQNPQSSGYGNGYSSYGGRSTNGYSGYQPYSGYQVYQGYQGYQPYRGYQPDETPNLGVTTRSWTVPGR